MNSKWIKISDHLPKEGVAVLLFSKPLEDGDACIVSASPRKKIGFMEDNRFTILDVEMFCDGSMSSDVESFTHWMPLPDDPIDDKGFEERGGHSEFNYTQEEVELLKEYLRRPAYPIEVLVWWAKKRDLIDEPMALVSMWVVVQQLEKI